MRPFPDVEAGKWQVSTDGGDDPVWSADGSKIYFLSRTDVMVSEVDTEPAFSRRPPRRVVGRGAYRFNGGKPYDVSPTDERLLLLRPVVLTNSAGTASAADTAQIVVVQNWFEELKRLVPVE